MVETRICRCGIQPIGLGKFEPPQWRVDALDVKVFHVVALDEHKTENTFEIYLCKLLI